MAAVMEIRISPASKELACISISFFARVFNQADENISVFSWFESVYRRSGLFDSCHGSVHSVGGVDRRTSAVIEGS